MIDPTPISSSAAEMLAPLVQSYCDSTLSPEDAARLEDLLRGSESHQRFFLARLDLHARLCWEAGRGSSFFNLPSPQRSPRFLPTARVRFAAIAAAVLLLLSVVSLVALHRYAGFPVISKDIVSNNSGSVSPTVASAQTATVINAAGLWTDQATSIQAGKVLSPGFVDLPQGVIELGYESGVRLLLESPARLELIDAKRAFLHSGRLTARVPHSASGFIVDTARAHITDLGTEFGVEVRAQGATRVQVYEGRVDAAMKDGVGYQHDVNHVMSGQAVAFASVKESLSFLPHRFLRSFPVVAEGRQPATLTSRPGVETVQVSRVTTPPRVDGDLSDWNPSQAFNGRCLDPSAADYFVKGMIAYDEHRLYVAAHVGDPAPLCSMVDYAHEPDYFWTGGAIVLRLAAGKTFGWPLDAARPREPNSSAARASDLSDQIVHIGMWYSRRLDRPMLVLQYGMDCHGQVLSERGWDGVFRADADGRGYTLEYAIDYSLLHASAPKSGDVWPANWTVHWSDADGRTCMGELSEIVNLSEPSFNPFRAKGWGKLQFGD